MYHKHQPTDNMAAPSSSSSSTPSTLVIAAATTAAAAAAVAFASLMLHRRRHHRHHRHLHPLGGEERMRSDLESRISTLEVSRKSERTGRIRAEMKLRTLLKRREGGGVDDYGGFAAAPGGGGDDRGDDDDIGDDDDDYGDAAAERPLLLRRIGRMRSPYAKRMGTPRQGSLVPSGRGYVQLDVPMECVSGLDGYSHAWIIFSFHANTDAPASPRGGGGGGIATATTTTEKANTNTKKKKKNDNDNARATAAWSGLSKTKVRPPRGNGIRVGMLATRSPHRPNNVGLSLVRISHVDVRAKRLHVTALDLVDGTPVYDIKPCVPWDVPGYRRNNDARENENGGGSEEEDALVVPDWVEKDDELSGGVHFEHAASMSLVEFVRRGDLAPLYTIENDGARGAMEAISQVLAQDPRSSNSNRADRRGTSSSSSSSQSSSSSSRSLGSYKMIFCRVEVEFRVDDRGAAGAVVDGGDEDRGGPPASSSGCNGGGGRGRVTVMSVRDSNLDGVERVDGIPVLLK